ncbi:MAG: auxin efflux carrier family protein [Ponticaulis sp.]|nr:auxin efflux carrier family protein [Ponticaulis sp.]|tara:strand:+ start:27711 stop:28646 length:936 start_codon:yes stop_codon:yes gene_type:complete
MSFFQALIPVIFMVVLGRFLARRNIPPAEGWRAIERLCYLVFIPALIILVLWRAPLETVPWKIGLTLLVAQCGMALIGLIPALWKSTPGPSVGCIVQSNSRWNTFIALTITGVLFGETGVALTAICAAIMIPLANILSILAFTYFGANESGVKRNPFAELIRNPLVIACLIGAALNVSGIKPSGTFETILELVSEPAMALGLMTVGAGIDLKALRRAGIRTFFWSNVRLFGLPLVAVPFAHFALGVDGVPLVVIAICTSTPTAVNGYILAKQMGGDAPFMANLIAAQTAMSVVTMFLVYLSTLWLIGGLPT